MKYKSKLIRGRAVRHQLPHGATAEPRWITRQEARSRRLAYRLNCGRDVYVEECHISLSTLGYFAGSADAIRTEVIRRLPDRAFEQFPSSDGVFVKPVPEKELPAYTFMVSLVCHQPVSDPAADFSGLVVCWLSDEIETSLQEMIDREIRAVAWDLLATDGIF